MTTTSADPTVLPGIDEYDVDLEGMRVHCWEGGTGRGVVLLHGSGAGAATLSNFRRVLGPLSKEFHVIAADLIGFGQSGLKAAEPYFDMDLWIRQLRMLIDRLGGESVVVVGHSLSGAIALKAAAQDARIAGVVTTATMGVPPEAAAGPRWRFPEDEEQVRQAVRRTFFDKSLAEDAEVRRRLALLGRPGYREYFERMFAGPAEDHIRASAVTTAELERVRCPVLLMHGRNDATYAPEDSSLALAKQLAHGDVYILSDCAHSVAHERPSEFISGVRTLVQRAAKMSEDRGDGIP